MSTLMLPQICDICMKSGGSGSEPDINEKTNYDGDWSEENY